MSSQSSLMISHTVPRLSGCVVAGRTRTPSIVGETSCPSGVTDWRRLVGAEAPAGPFALATVRTVTWRSDRVSTLGPRRVIEPEQLSGALERLDPRERELLALSLRRRVPDEALARVYDVDAHEVARRRAGAIERLADELGAQRGEDLGVVLQALLDEGTWSAAELAEGGQTASVGETEILPEAEGAPAAVEEPEAPEHEAPEPDSAEPESTNGHPPVVSGAERARARDARRARGHSRAGRRSRRPRRASGGACPTWSSSRASSRP